MSTEMIVDAVRKQFEAASEALVAWRPEDSNGAAQVAFVEDALIIFLDRPLTMRRLVERVREAQHAGRISNLLRVWHHVSILFDLAVRQASEVRMLAGQAREAGYRVEGAEAFERSVRELEELRDDFRKTFAVTTDAEAAADRTAIARGEYRDTDEAFAQIAGVDLETWRQRVAEYERGQRG